MEGIRDGQAIDRCFYCGLLYPNLESCSHCERRLRYEPAHSLDADELAEQAQALVKLFQSNATRENAERLLRFWFRYQEEENLWGSEPSIAALRQAYSES